LSDIEKFAFFMRFLAPPTPSLIIPGGAAPIAAGRALFQSTGCAYCHTPTLYTGDSAIAGSAQEARPPPLGPARPPDGTRARRRHHPGTSGTRRVPDGTALGPRQRIFFLHDGRTSDLLVAIRAHKSAGNNRFQASEANAVIDKFNQLNEAQKQDLLNFLRSL